MLDMDETQKNLLMEIADIKDTPQGAYNLRANGESVGRRSTANVAITPRETGAGLDIRIKPGVNGETVHIPVVMNKSGVKETVCNDFYVGKDADVLIIAGCGIHNDGGEDSEHDGVHRFFLEPGAKVKYVEKHYGEGNGNGKRILNPVTEVTMAEGSFMEMEMAQIKGVDSTERITTANLSKGAHLIVRERLMTHGEQKAISVYKVVLDGENSGADVVSRSVAKDTSYQKFDACIIGNAPCHGHTECDSIIMDQGRISAVPSLEANHIDAELMHEAAIGKIAGDQLIKLMTMGLSEKEAEEQIVNGFLK